MYVLTTASAPGPTWLEPRICLTTGHRRMGALVDLRLACRAGPYDVDVLVRDMERPRGVEIIGQLTLANDLHVPACDIDVALISSDPASPLDRVRTSAFGEFIFPRRGADLLGLRLGHEADAPVVLVWDRRT